MKSQHSKLWLEMGLAPVHKFYRRMGAIEKGRIEVHEGQGSVVYVYKVI